MRHNVLCIKNRFNVFYTVLFLVLWLANVEISKNLK